MSFDQLRNQLHEQYDSLSPHLQRLARYALHNANGFALNTVSEVARHTDVQPSSVVRFAKTFGFSGFSDLQRVFKHRLIEGTPELREQAYRERESLEQIAEDQPLRLFQDFADASVDAINGLRNSISNEDLQTALAMLERAATVYVIGQRRAFPVSSYIAYGLRRLELPCSFIDFVGGMAPQQAAAITDRDLLIAVSFAEYAPSVVDIVKDVYIRGIPLIAITDSELSPLATHSTLSFKVRDDTIRRFRPLAPSLLLAQTLILGLSYLKDQETAR
jgi:DNA-binding MurR/RpiR family transcriptional regulator